VRWPIERPGLRTRNAEVTGSNLLSLHLDVVVPIEERHYVSKLAPSKHGMMLHIKQLNPSQVTLIFIRTVSSQVRTISKAIS
jgi:hypothetical protein